MKGKKRDLHLALIGRDTEFEKLQACLLAGKNILLEGPVGVGKTHLALAVTESTGRPVFRIDGDSRYSEQKLSGWFDPPTVIQKGYTQESFIPGPLVDSMRAGGVLFINELNRLPEGVQNILLPAIDEQTVIVPRLGEVRAQKGFVVIATQNPREFVATSHLSEAILDRFELVVIDYQPENEETEIVSSHLKKSVSEKIEPLLPVAAVKLCRLSRDDSNIRRGASVRAALSIAELAHVFISTGKSFEQAFLSAAFLAMPTRIEIERNIDTDQTTHQEIESLITAWVQMVLEELSLPRLKKNSS